MKLLEIIGDLLVFVPLLMGVMWFRSYLAQRRYAGLGWIALIAGMAGLIVLVVGVSHATH